jgi:predicted transcriptional regulator
MDEFNLIPNEYHESRKKLNVVRLLSSATIALSCLFAVLLVSAASIVDNQEVEADELRERKALSMQQQERLKELTARKDQLQGQVLLLESLRSGASVTELLHTVESAVAQTDVWFIRWQFRRAGIQVEDDPEVRAPSYFVIAKKPSEFPRRWSNMTHMTIQGEAKDHSALSEFVQRLFQHPTVDDVRVQRSTKETQGISFSLAVVVKTEGMTS